MTTSSSPMSSCGAPSGTRAFGELPAVQERAPARRRPREPRIPPHDRARPAMHHQRLPSLLPRAGARHKKGMSRLPQNRPFGERTPYGAAL